MYEICRADLRNVLKAGSDCAVNLGRLVSYHFTFLEIHGLGSLYLQILANILCSCIYYYDRVLSGVGCKILIISLHIESLRSTLYISDMPFRHPTCLTSVHADLLEEPDHLLASYGECGPSYPYPGRDLDLDARGMSTAGGGCLSFEGTSTILGNWLCLHPSPAYRGGP